MIADCLVNANAHVDISPLIANLSNHDVNSMKILFYYVQKAIESKDPASHILSSNYFSCNKELAKEDVKRVNNFWTIWKKESLDAGLQ